MGKQEAKQLHESELRFEVYLDAIVGSLHRVISYTKSAVTDSVNQKSAFEESSEFRLTQGVAA